MSDALDIITIGEGLLEFSSSESLAYSETFSKFYGGDTLTSAVAALRAGSDVGYIAKVGNDCFGEYLLDAWQLEGLDTSQVKLAKGQNGVYFIARGADGAQSIFYRKKTAATMLSIEDINFDLIKKAKLVYATGFVQSLSLSCSEVVREVFACAKKNDVQVAYSPNFSPEVWSQDEAKEAFDSVSQYIDIIFMNTKADSMAIFDTQSPDKIFNRTSDLAIGLAVITESLKPTFVCSDGEVSEIPLPQESAVVDTTGADAAFAGTFLSYYLNGFDPVACAKYANIVASVQLQNMGAIRSIPNKDTTEELFRSVYG